MHIPDGYLGPQTYIPMYAVFAGFISVAIKKLKEKLTTRFVPYLGMATAFTFLIMMFNVPIPGGTTGHAVGAAIVGIILGPWVALIAVSIALIIQALIFGDGGITAIGANCFNMAIVMPFVAVWVFNLIRQNSDNPVRLRWAAFFSGYISLNIAAIVTAFMFGIQPIIAKSPEGTPLYSPYPLKIAIPAMATEHLVLFGIVEGVITMLIFSYFYKNQKDIIFSLK